TPLDKGTKRVPFRLMGEEVEKKMFFTVDVPGIKQDYKKSDVEKLYLPGELIPVNPPELQKKLEAMPCCTTNRQGKKNGDPLNLVMIAEFQDMLDAMTLSGWDETEALSFASAGRMMKAFFTGSEYRYSPVSNLYFEGRKHDVAFQKTRENINERLHLRLWLTPYTFEGKSVWAGQISRDIGIRLTRRTWNLTTHKIDPDIDESRDYLFADLSLVERLGRFGYVSGVGKALRTSPRRNLTGDPYYTDGLRLVVEITGDDSKPVFMGWKILQNRSL
ncbi:MAG TPA: LssY C-terminal domain-containing protein, partial [bacterium]|nr:LssY C-terminal domain-containing protein [bacterium]